MNDTMLRCDLVVAGGGPAGVPCAIAAARAGASVVLVQDRPVLGGNASSEVRMHIVGADCGGGRGTRLTTEAREGGIIEEIRLEASVRNPQRSPTMFDLILYEKIRAEPNIKLLLNTTVVGVEMSNSRITRAIAHRQSTEDRFLIDANLFIDCTGDGRMGAEAGAPFFMGREGQEVYGEPLAPAESDKHTLGSTLLFQARRHDHPMPFVAPPWARKFTEEQLKLRHHNSHGGKGYEYGYWWIEWGGHLNTIKDNEAIRDELLAIMLGVWDHIKNQPGHDADNWALDWFGFLPGKRESRRFVGLHVLSESDVFQSKEHPDAIAFGGWFVDLHPYQGVDAANEPPCTQHHLPYLFDIPLRSCVSSDIGNLMFAGRNISASHVAFASTRVMATCAVVGEGVGVAAAAAVRHGLNAHELCERPDLIKTIQRDLLRKDCYLIGQVHRDERNLAARATVRATSHQPGGEPVNVISGQSRSVHGHNGAPQHRVMPGTHRWLSDPAAGLPATLSLHWPESVNAGIVEIIFDTGMHRLLTLTNSDHTLASMIWGRPQPETVSSYTLEFVHHDRMVSSLNVQGNYQRWRTHVQNETTSSMIDELRIIVHATHGLDHASIVEVRVFDRS